MTALAAVETPPELNRNDFPAGCVIVPCHDMARWHQFTYDINHLDVPDGTLQLMNRSSSIVQNVNMIVEQMLESEAEWAWIIGDDHGFKRDVVLKLLEHDRDVIVPLCAKHGPPFSLVVYDRECGYDEEERPLYNTMQYPDLPTDGEPFQVEAAGTAGMLVKRHVFETIGEPWFRNWDDITINEDFVFCRRVREAGFEIWVDPKLSISHIGMLAAFPELIDGTWGLSLDLQGAQIHIPNGIKLESGKPQFTPGRMRGG